MHVLQHARERRGLSQRALSRMSGVSHPTISRIERSQVTASYANAYVLAQFLFPKRRVNRMVVSIMNNEEQVVSYRKIKETA